MLETIAGLVNLNSALLGLFLLAILLIGFVLERFPPVIVAVSGVAVCLVLGFIGPSEMLKVFANPAPVTIAALFILSGALVRTGAIEALVAVVVHRAEKKPRQVIGELFAGALGFAGFVNNTPVVIILLPVVRKLAKIIGTASSRLFIPLSYVAILGGTLTLIGTSTNLLVDGVSRELGQPGFGLFEITGVGLITATAGVLALAILGPWLLPDRPDREAAEEDYLCLSELTVSEESSAAGKPTRQVPALKPQRAQVLAIKREGGLQRNGLHDMELEPGDRLIVAASPHELASLAAAHDFVVGMGELPGRSDLSSEARFEDVELVEATVAPSHPSIGLRLAEIPLLSRLPVQILGISRGRQIPGPNLPDTRIRAADRILIAARSRELEALRTNPHLLGVSLAEARPFRRTKAPIAIGALGGAIVLAAAGVLPIVVLTVIAVAIVLITRCIDPEEAWSSIDGNVLVLIFAMLAIGTGLQNAGSVDLLVEAMMPLLVEAHPFVLILSIYLLTSVLTETVTNNAVAVIMTPVVIGIADQLGMDPKPLLAALMFAGSASFATPVGYQTNTIVYAAARYRFADFLKIGIPMNLVVGTVAATSIYWLFPA